MAAARTLISQAHDHLSRAASGTVFAHPDEEDPLELKEGFYEYVDVDEALWMAQEGLNLLKEAHSLMLTKGNDHDPLSRNPENAQAH
jgi:hypothetical protein